MKFGNIYYLLLIFFIPFLVLFYYRALKLKETKLVKFLSPEVLKKVLPYNWKSFFIKKAIFINLSILFMILALAQPKYGFREEEVIKKGSEIVVAVDLSKSMKATDIKPDRLSRAKMKLNDFLRILQGDKIALVAFSGTAFLQCPLTLDYEAFQVFLEYLDTDLIPVGGTSIGNALDVSINAFSKSSSKNKSIILITDGEDQENIVNPFIKTLKEKNIKVFSIGIGKEEGAPIPDANGFKTDENGKIILTKLDTKVLKKLSEETGGVFIRSVSGDIDVKKIYSTIKDSGEEQEFSSGKKQILEDRFQIFLLIAFIFLLLEFFSYNKKQELVVK